MPPRSLTLKDLHANLGAEVAVSDWLAVTQDRIDAFAEVSEDRQWIHVDPERAKHESLFGGTIAHGFLTVALLAKLRDMALHIEGATMGVNIGFNRLRFTAPVPSGSRIRARFALHELKEFPGGVQTTFKVTVECDGSDKPVLVCDWVTRHYG